jgi:hypothetical protein
MSLGVKLTIGSWGTLLLAVVVFFYGHDYFWS